MAGALRPRRRAAGLIAAGLLAALLAVGAAVAVPRWLDWSRYRDTVAALASAGLGRPVRIDGPIRLSLLPQARLVAEAVTLGDNGDGAQASVVAMRLRVSLPALLAGRIEVSDLRLDGADMRVPWPWAAGPWTRPPAWLTGLRVAVNAGRLQVGGQDITGIDGTLAIDAATGALSAQGIASVMGHEWRLDGRLGRPGADGIAILALSVDGEGGVRNTGGTLFASVAADGTLSGRVTARGPDLSLLLPTPAVAWRASGRLSTGRGLVLAEDLDVDLAGAPARGGVAVRLLPAARVDAALAASRLDLDRWWPALLSATATAVPTSLDLSAEQATLAGGTLHRLRAGFDLSAAGTTLRDGSALLPGEAAFALSGQWAGGLFNGRASLDAADWPATLRWLQPHAPALAAVLPRFGAVNLAGSVSAGLGMVALGGLQGSLDGARLGGDAALRPGPRPAVAATLSLDGPVLDGWQPAGLLPPAGLDAELSVTATRPVWHGLVLDNAALDLRLANGAAEIRRVTVAGLDLAAEASGSVSPTGSLSDGRATLHTARASAVARLLPVRGLDGLLHGAAELTLSAAGDPASLALSATTTVGDAQLRLAGQADLVGRRYAGSVWLRHPGAPRFLAALGVPDTASWLGDGSLTVQGQVDAAPGRVAVAGLDVSAGGLRLGADGTATGLGGTPEIAGQVVAESLTLPMPYPGSAAPLPLGLLRGWSARLGIKAAHLSMGQSPVADDATATATLAGGVLRLDGVAAKVADGALRGEAVFDATALPRLTASASLSGATIAAPLADTPLDLAGGRVDATIRLAASGYSPAAMLASLSGEGRFSVADGILAGLDANRALAALAAPDAATPAAVTAALAAGSTAFTRLEGGYGLSSGIVTLQQTALTLPGGTGTLSGTVSLPDGTLDLGLSLQASPDGPAAGLRASGPADAPRRTPELAGLARWLATR